MIQVKTVSAEYDTVPVGLTWLIVGQPKTRKTTEASKWSSRNQKGVLIIDTDLGADFVKGANIVTVTSLNPPVRYKLRDGKKILQDGEPLIELIPPEERGFYHRTGSNIGKPMAVYSIAEVYTELKKDFLGFDTVVIDTINEVNSWIEDIVAKEMNITVMGDAGWGADWGRARKRNLDIIKRMQNLAKKFGKTLVLISHAKHSTIEDGKIQLMPELPRGLAYALSSKADVIGYVTMDKQSNQAHISFRSYDERVVGSRLRALAQKKVPFNYEAIKKEVLSYKEEI